MINKSFLNSFGPGILFAGAAIGTSHLVQSTRAGAIYGLGLILVVVFANLIKYPLFRFGPLYTAATGKSILHGYRELGRWAVIVVILTELPVNIIIVAATALVTGSIALSVFDLNIKVTHLAVLLIFFAFTLIGFGGYKFIDRCTKLFVAILTVCTLTATILTIPIVDWSISNFAHPEIDAITLAFILALLGFMPAGASLSLLHSVWSVEKTRVTGYRPNVSEAMFDLNIGYISSTLLAVCFLIMGAGSLHENSAGLSSNPGEFAGQVISMYSNTMGSWAGFLVGISVFTVMISTLLTTLDGFARMQEEALKQLFKGSGHQNNGQKGKKPARLLLMAVIGVFACLVLLSFMTNFKSFIDFVTITAFVVGPIIAILNHIAIHGKGVPKTLKPRLYMTLWSLAGIGLMLFISCFYLLSKL